MNSFLTFLAEMRDGLFVLFLASFLVIALTQWVLWMFRWGRFAAQGKAQDAGVFRELLTKIIYEFRHLLALVVVMLFAGTLFAAMWPGIMKQDVAIMRDGLQAVAANLGGLIGSIIGYYFGESAANKGRIVRDTAPPPPAEPAVDKPPRGGGLEIPPKPAVEKLDDTSKP